MEKISILKVKMVRQPIAIQCKFVIGQSQVMNFEKSMVEIDQNCSIGKGGFKFKQHKYDRSREDNVRECKLQW